jgi:hypothetical protein
VNYRQLSSYPDTPASEALGVLGRVTKVCWETRRSRPLMILSLTLMTLGLLTSRAANAQVINYPNGFTSGCWGSSSGNPIWLENVTTQVGTSLQLTTFGIDHKDVIDFASATF